MDPFDRDPSLLDRATEKVRDVKAWHTDEKPWAYTNFKKRTTSAESHYLYRVASLLGTGVYVDVGTMHGGSAATMGLGLRDSRTVGSIVCADYFGTISGPHGGSAVAPERLRAYFENELRLWATLDLRTGESSAVGRTFGCPIRFAFIDACHDYEHCKADFEAWSPHVDIGGMIAFHDTHFLGVDRTIRELGPQWEQTQHVYSMKVFRKRRG